MSISEIRESGLLELYVLDQLTEAERAGVDAHLTEHPELRKDVNAIEAALETYARSTALKAPTGVKDRLLEKIRRGDDIEKADKTTTDSTSLTDSSSEKEGADQQTPDVESEQSSGKAATGSTEPSGDRGRTGGGKSGWIWKLLAGLLALGALWLWMQQRQAIQDLEAAQGAYVALHDSCETAQAQDSAEIARLQTMLTQLADPDNQVYTVDATARYPQTDFYLHHNASDGRNFIQVRSLPTLAANQSFQLWALKGTDSPVPLDVFERQSNLFAVRYVADVDAYAITIEPRGGSAEPNLAELIGVVAVGR